MILSACQGARLNCATGLDGVGSHVCSSGRANIHDEVPGPVIAAVKADRKSESQLRTTSQPHATYAAVHRSRLPASRLCALKNAGADLGAASLTQGISWYWQASEALCCTFKGSHYRGE